MPDNIHLPLAWRKSSKSTTSNCVEFAQAPGFIALRDSKDSAGPQLQISAAAWISFTHFAPSLRR